MYWGCAARTSFTDDAKVDDGGLICESLASKDHGLCSHWRAM